MEKVSARVASLAVSQTLAMSQKSKELKKQGVKVIDLSVGEPDFHTPDFVKEAAFKAINENITFYSPVAGFPDLLEAISNKLKRENGLTYAPEQIVVSNGAKQTLSNVILTLIDKDDEVIIPAPYWVSYSELVKLAEGKNVIIPTSIDDDFKVTPKQLADAITPRTKLLILCSPSNPTGSIYTKDELAAIADVVAQHPNLYVISDEIYEHINFVGKHESFAQFKSIADRVIIINGVSKGYAMTGWRIGYMAGPTWIAKACSKLQGQTTSGPNSIAQKAATVAINSDGSYPALMCKAFLKRRDLMIDGLSKIKGFKTNVPQGAFYIFPDISYFFGKSDGETTINNADDFAMYILNKAHVAIVSGNAFGAPECIRFSYAASDEDLTYALEQIAKTVVNLK
ncbi:MAG TPA: pyridoxal phosphate-dependent aminotransferase [Tenuifilaceae bacterium]|nr:pyridoxal phosphate-dependent aminotransferase [Tenuifilaceae bacterium]HQB77857.1 pyridoxal phosphate-dependent aminotransferase [Tenuifilaceae bacterium]